MRGGNKGIKDERNDWGQHKIARGSPRFERVRQGLEQGLVQGFWYSGLNPGRAIVSPFSLSMAPTTLPSVTPASATEDSCWWSRPGEKGNWQFARLPRIHESTRVLLCNLIISLTSDLSEAAFSLLLIFC